MVKVAINGFGRIGRLAYRVALLHYPNELDIVAVNTSGSMDVEGWAHLVKYDTTYRKFPQEVTFEKIREASQASDETPEIGKITAGGKTTLVLAQRDPEKLPWSKLGVEIV